MHWVCPEVKTCPLHYMGSREGNESSYLFQLARLMMVPSSVKANIFRSKEESPGWEFVCGSAYIFVIGILLTGELQ